VKPVTVSVDVPDPREEVFEFLNALSNRESFQDHLLVKWSYSGPERGVGARARARAAAPMSQDWNDKELIEADPPKRIVEEDVSAKGKRRTRSTYVLEDLPGGGARVSLEYEWLAAPRLERLTPPLNRAFMRRANRKSLRRLAKQLRKR
jgi:polyketide cyclase/dehydrase/lipid transport protein